MSEEIINDLKYGLAVSTFWDGLGVGVQFTPSIPSTEYAQMTLKDAIKFLKEALKKLEKI